MNASSIGFTEEMNEIFVNVLVGTEIQDSIRGNGLYLRFRMWPLNIRKHCECDQALHMLPRELVEYPSLEI